MKNQKGACTSMLNLSFLSENVIFRDGKGNFEFTIVMYDPENGQRS